MSMPRIVIIDRHQNGESANPSPENILAGIPRARVSNQYADASQQFFLFVKGMRHRVGGYPIRWLVVNLLPFLEAFHRRVYN